MLQASGEQGELWWVADPLSAEVPLVSEDGWEWFPRELSQRWWATVPLVVDGDTFVETDPVCVPAARVVTRRCLKGANLTALVMVHPLSLALTAAEWELHVETRVSPPTMGPPRPPQTGATTALLRGVPPSPSSSLSGSSETLLGCLRHGRMAFQGLVEVSQGLEGLTLSFKEIPVLERI